MKNKQREREEMMRVSPPLLGELRGMIEESRRSLAGAVNASMTMLYWQIGTRIVATLSQELNRSNFCAIIPLEKSLRRDFYAEMCRVERWSAQGSARSVGVLLKEGK
jgi:hypothetical protein